VVKTIGLIALMAQSGLHVPASRGAARLAQVLGDIGDHNQSPQTCRPSRLTCANIAEMAERVSPPALILASTKWDRNRPRRRPRPLGVAIVDSFTARTTTVANDSLQPAEDVGIPSEAC